MITKELVEKAVMSGHDQCEKAEGGCIHAKGFTAAEEKVTLAIMAALTASEEQNLEPTLGLLMEGIHIGYRLQQLEFEQTHTSN